MLTTPECAGSIDYQVLVSDGTDFETDDTPLLDPECDKWPGDTPGKCERRKQESETSSGNEENPEGSTASKDAVIAKYLK